MKRDAAQTIFRTVVFAGAMLGAGAGCTKKQPAPANPTPTPMSADPATPDPAGETPAADPNAGGDPCAAGGDPCAERPRGTDDDGGGGAGRGFVLS